MRLREGDVLRVSNKYSFPREETPFIFSPLLFGLRRICSNSLVSIRVGAEERAPQEQGGTDLIA